MGFLAVTVWQRIAQGQADRSALARALLQLSDKKRLLVYLPGPQVGTVLGKQVWHGALRSAQGTS
jgi:hypothetical protein